MRSILRNILLMALASSFTTASAQSSPDTLQHKGNVVERLIRYFETSNKTTITRKPKFTFVAGPHYSKESGFGLGLVLGGNYSTDPEDTRLPLSNISIVGDVATENLYMIGVKGEHVNPGNKSRFNYQVNFRSMTSDFWGIGYDNAIHDYNKCSYKDLRFRMSGFYEWRTASYFYVGPRAEIVYEHAGRDIEPELCGGQARHLFSAGVGAHVCFDSRDNHTAPRQGWLLEAEQMFYPRLLGNACRSFTLTHLAANHYNPLWKGATLALRFKADLSYGHTPWSMLPSLGGEVRSYYEGRYRDKDAVNLVAELRQHVYRRSGVAVWVGAGNVFPKLSAFTVRHTLPEAGIGYRFEFKQDSNLRVDFGIGRGSTGFVFSLNESF